MTKYQTFLNLGAFTVNKVSMAFMIEYVFNKGENNLKGENARYQHFVLPLQCF